MSIPINEAQPLEPYGGRDVIASAITIPNLGGGLRKAFSVDKVLLPIGSRGTIVVDYEVVGHQHKEVKDTDALELVNVLGCTGAAMVDRNLVGDALDAQARRVEEGNGITRLPYSDEADNAEDVDDPDDDVPDNVTDLPES